MTLFSNYLKRLLGVFYMAKTRQQKEETVQILSDKLTKANSLVFADYKGLTMSQLQELRSKLREHSAEFSITKNSLLSLALQNVHYDLPSEIVDGPTATLFSFGDEITPIKITVKAFKEFQKGEVRGGFLGMDLLDKFRVISLSNLPTKPELQGQIVGVLVAPLHGIVGVLNANLRNLVYAVDQIRQQAEQKGGE